MGLVSVVILILSSLCVNTTLMAIVGERSKEFALQKALGASGRDIIRQMLTETMIISLAAAVCGAVLGYLLASGLGAGGVQCGNYIACTGIAANLGAFVVCCRCGGRLFPPDGLFILNPLKFLKESSE
ncbi:hypothetical protein L328_0123150 [Yersinia pestis 24H]|nr:hypothetical protein L328_0123150 [Yersinia pestis 24H]